MCIVVSWVVTPCSLGGEYQMFWRNILPASSGSKWLWQGWSPMQDNMGYGYLAPRISGLG